MQPSPRRQASPSQRLSDPTCGYATQIAPAFRPALMSVNALRKQESAAITRRRPRVAGLRRSSSTTARRPAEDGYAAPHLHTHVVVFNITMLSTGEARPVKSPDLLTQEYGDAVYLSELAHRLYRLGYELDVDARGQFEIRGYTPEYLAACRPEGVLLRRRAADSPKRLRGTD
jgi:hypothetical protein